MTQTSPVQRIDHLLMVVLVAVMEASLLAQPSGARFDPQNLPSILPEQLGLKLELTRASVDVPVIDRAEKPVEQP